MERPKENEHASAPAPPCASLVNGVMALPQKAIKPASARGLLKDLAWFADRGIEEPAKKWLEQTTGLTGRRLVDLFGILERGGWILTREELCKGRVRYTVVGEKLNVNRPAWDMEATSRKRSACRHTKDGVATDSTGNLRPFREQISSCPSEISAPEAGKCSIDAEKISAEGYFVRAPGLTRPNPSIHPSFLAYAWPSDEVKAKAVRVLEICGPGLADIERYGLRILASLEALLTGRWGNEDFLRMTVLPMVDKKTEKRRELGKELKDFYLIDRSIDEEIDQRKTLTWSGRQAPRPSASASSRSSKFNEVCPPRAEPRIVYVRRNVERMRDGRFLAIDIHSSERAKFYASADEREAVCVKALADGEAELARLESRNAFPRTKSE